ncbi:MAG: sulfurtransferase [Pseudomonadota bacterium]
MTATNLLNDLSTSMISAPDALKTVQIAKQNNIKLHFIDASWYLPNQSLKRDARAEFLEQHIEGAHFFDIDLFCDLDNPIPHALPDAKTFSDLVTPMGIGKHDAIIFYEKEPIFSAPRAWFMFKLFGHQNLKILDGGLNAWIQEEGALSHHITSILPKTQAPYQAKMNADMLCNMAQLQHIIAKDKSHKDTPLIYDARSQGRFDGTQNEPRKGLLSGHMPNAINVPVNQLYDDQRRLHDKNKLKRLFFDDTALDKKQSAICTCGSGITACSLFLALSELKIKHIRLYDGSWSEWASTEDNPIIRQQI